MKNIAVIVAGGSSTRCGFDKLFTDEFGVPVIEQTLSLFQEADHIDEIVLVLSVSNFAKGTDLKVKFPKIEKVIPGGAARFDSVQNAIEYLRVKNTNNVRVIVHNGANHSLKTSELEQGIALAETKKNVIFGYFSPNSIKKVSNGQVDQFLDRATIFETQTPQISDLETFVLALKTINADKMSHRLPRDEAELLALINEKIFTFECCSSNQKITFAEDFRQKNTEIRIGTGIDSHRFLPKFDPQKPIVLGGVSMPESEKSFDANSDGDVILHSFCNAILSAFGEKTFDEFAGKMCKSGITDSLKYVEKSFEIVRKKHPNFRINNVTFSLEGKYPKLAKRHDDIIVKLEKVLHISKEKIGLNYTTGEELTSFGKGKGVHCLCNLIVQVG